MPYFRYLTLDQAGNEIEETLEAVDEKAAADVLRARKKFVTALQEVAPVSEKAGYEFSWVDYLNPLTTTDIAFFFRQLSSLITSGVTLVNSLYVLGEQEKKGRMRKLIGQIRLDVQGGKAFTVALGRHPGQFDSMVVGMVEAGEAGGMLNLILDRIATTLEERAALRSQMVTGAVYPVLVLIAVVLVVGFLVGFVIPKLTPILKLKGSRLPWNTQLLIDSSSWFKANWMFSLAGIGVFVSSAYLACRTSESVRYWLDRWKIKLPVLGPVIRYALVVQFARNLSTLIESGVSMIESLRITGNTIKNRAVKKVIETMETHILKGENLSAPLKGADFIFPPMVATMVAVGEETGRMDASLSLAADIHEKLLKTYFDRMSALIEPILIVVLGLIVGFVAWSLISGVLVMYHV